jgi:hypothetical protein
MREWLLGGLGGRRMMRICIRGWWCVCYDARIYGLHVGMYL